MSETAYIGIRDDKVFGITMSAEDAAGWVIQGAQAVEKVSLGVARTCLFQTWPTIAEGERLIGLLREAVSEIVWSAYYQGIERDGKWMDGGMKDATQLQHDLGLEPGWHDAATIKARVPEAVEVALTRVLEPRP